MSDSGEEDVVDSFVESIKSKNNEAQNPDKFVDEISSPLSQNQTANTNSE